MKIRFKTLALVLSILAFIAWAPPILAYDEDYGPPMAVDLFGLRPFGIAATLAGGVVYLISLPFTVTTGSAGDAWDTMVAEPARFTFARPLGGRTHKGMLVPYDDGP